MSIAELHEPLIPVLRAVLADLEIPRAARVLDVGCGDCAKWPLYRDCLGAELALLGADLDRAALRGPGALVVADAHALPFPDAACGAALCVATLGLLADRGRALREMRRVLAPGAPLLIVTAERRWALVRRWPPALAARLAAPLDRAARAAHPDLIGDLGRDLEQAGLGLTHGRAFLAEAGLPPLAAELALLPWGQIRAHAAGVLSAGELAACDAQEPDLELCSVVLVAHAHAPQ
jgi:SAM-dependent methyltransferase